MNLLEDKIDIVKYDINKVPVGQLHVSYKILDCSDELFCDLDGIQTIFIPSPISGIIKVIDLY